MYAEFYGLRELPFNITPDPRFLYLNDCYQEALAALTYGIDARRGFISLIGEAGTGKTTLLRRLLDTLGAGTKTVLLLNPTVSFDEILEHILLELGVPPEGGRKLVLLQRLNEFLLEHTQAGGNVALLIDEAQDLSPSVLENLRLLSNLETAREKILQIVLAGQPELEATLADPSLRQLRQRVTLRVRIRPLAPVEVASYVRSRLERAGTSTPELFAAAALDRVAALSQGIPRVVNVLCDASLLVAFAAGSRQVTPALVDEAWRDYAADVELLPAETVVLPVAVPAEPPRVSVAPPVEPEEQPLAAAPPAERPIVASQDPEPPREEPPAPPPPVAPALPPAPPPATHAYGASRRPPLPPPPRSKFSVPAAAAGVAILAVMLSFLSLQQEWMDRALDDGSAQMASTETAPTQGLATTLEATAAEPPSALAGTDGGSAAPAPSAPEGPPSATEAATLIDEFRNAYEARDTDRLVQLFATDASENGMRGIDAIASSYRERLPAFSEVRYSVPRLSVEAQGLRADVRGPFVITYRKAGGARGEIRGQVEWELERRQGRTRIVALNYRIDPES